MINSILFGETEYICKGKMTALGTAHASATPQWNRHSVVTTEQQIWGVDLSFSPLTGLSFRVYFLFFNQLLEHLLHMQNVFRITSKIQ